MLPGLTCLIFPVFLILACAKLKPLDKLGVVLLAFAAGILAGNLLDLPDLFNLSQAALDRIRTQVSEVSIALAIPLLLFSMDLRAAVRLAGTTLKSAGLALFSVMGASLAGCLIFQGQVREIWQVAGMAVGAYTGGGPNMAAIKTAIQGDEQIFLTMVTYDILFSAIYLLFILTLSKQVFSRFLPRHSPGNSLSRNPGPNPEKVPDHTPDQIPDTVPEGLLNQNRRAAMAAMADESARAYKLLIQTAHMKDTARSFICAGITVAAALAACRLLPLSMQPAGAIILITTLGLAGAFVPGVRRLRTSFRLGMYLILVFCFTLGSMADAGVLLRLDPGLAGYLSFLLLGATFSHLVLCRIFRVDVDTFIITSAAAIMSVPFIPVIAGTLKNRDLLVPGFAAAILGYAAGNYLGVLAAAAARWLTAVM